MRILAFFVYLILTSCASKPSSQEIENETPLTFRTETLEKESCVGENCAKLRLSWPMASGGEAAAKINPAIDEMMGFLVQTGEAIAPLDSMVAQYFSSFEAFKSEFPDSYGGWEIEAAGTVSYESDSTLSIYFTQFSFLGAHILLVLSPF